jgi:cell division protein FtsB
MKIQPNQAWLIFFSLWALVLTGLFDPWIQSPGLRQWFRVRETLSDRRQEIAEIEARSTLLRQVASQLEANPVAQEREIRKVLGFLGDHEVVFDFAP